MYEEANFDRFKMTVRERNKLVAIVDGNVAKLLLNK